VLRATTSAGCWGNLPPRPGRAFLRLLGCHRLPRLLVASHADTDKGNEVGPNTTAPTVTQYPGDTCCVQRNSAGPTKYLNNLIEQDHRALKRIVRPVLGFKDFDCARRLIAGIETMHMVKKGQLDGPNGQALSAADQIYSIAV
jgi:hypothetical protein